MFKSIKNKILLAIALLVVIATSYWLLSPKPVTLPEMTVQEKKARFKKIVIPPVVKVHAELLEQYQHAAELIANNQGESALADLRDKYKVTDNEALLMALKPHPKSIAIAQAAMESSWATSRFTLEANNLFDVWSFNEDEPRIAASQKRGDKTIWVKKYDSVEDSIRDYYLTLGRSHAFKGFRELRLESESPFELVKKLDRYSEKGAAYGEELTSIIKFNKFDEYD